jgi:RIO kinase 1
MTKLNPNLFLDENFEVYGDRSNRRQGRHKYGPRPSQPDPEEEIMELVEQAEGLEKFDFIYQASRHERQWIIDSLGGFYEGHWLEDVLRLIKGGKEASVYQCAANPQVIPGQRYLAAKVYRPRKFRSLKNDHLYREGRVQLDSDGHEITDDGMLHAIHKRTSYGQQLMHESWIEHEYQALQALHAAGADVPEPYARGDNAILMAYVGGPEMAAPTLNSVNLEPRGAGRLFDRVIENVGIMLENECIHGDLSAYNILYWDGEITLIDFPQVVSPHENRNAYRIFKRDVARVCEYFSRQGVASDADRIGVSLWKSFRYSEKPDVHPGLLDDQDEADLAYWRRWVES